MMALVCLYLLGIIPGVLLCCEKGIGLLCGPPLILLTFVHPIPTAVIGGFILFAIAMVFLKGCVAQFDHANRESSEG